MVVEVVRDLKNKLVNHQIVLKNQINKKILQVSNNLKNCHNQLALENLMIKIYNSDKK